MKILLNIFVLVLLISADLFAWDNKVTHKDLSKYAAENSVLDISKGNYIMKNLGFTSGLAEKFMWNNKSQSVLLWIREGADFEDNGTRWRNHFHNPLKRWLDAGLSDIWWGQSSLLWTQSYDGSQQPMTDDWSWQRTRKLYHLALTSADAAVRSMFFAETFRGLGQQMHLVQDMAVPAHTRNDAHPLDALVGTNSHGHYLETWTKNSIRNLDELKSFATISTVDSSIPHLVFSAPTDTSVNVADLAPITNLFDTNQYDGTNPSTTNTIGLAEYTNANYFSDDTISMPGIWTSTDHSFPYPNASSTNLQDYIYSGAVPTTVTAEDGVADQGFWIQKTGDEPIVHFVKPGYLTTPLYSTLGGGSVYERTFFLDDECHKDYAEKLLPRAVGYSAGLLNYFFRGILEISAPDQFVYAMADGSMTPHQFTTVKAKVRNTTPNENIGAGTIQAVARYKKRTDYQPDLSTDPPTPASREADFSNSVSAPVSITSLDTVTPTEFSFDFSSSPIPAGITDLYLQVIFKGTLGNETDTAVAVGMKDINEPMHIVVWNSTDRFYLDGALRTADEIRNDSQLLSRVDHNGDGVSDEYIDPYAITSKLAFSSTSATPGSYPVTYSNLPAGRYGRMIVLTDATSFYMHGHDESVDPAYSSDYYYVYGGVVNRENNGTFENTQVSIFRGIIQHQWTALARFYPYSTGIEAAPWPVPVDTTPYPATTITQ